MPRRKTKRKDRMYRPLPKYMLPKIVVKTGSQLEYKKDGFPGVIVAVAEYYPPKFLVKGEAK